MASIRDKCKERPLELENPTLLQYAKQWEVFTRKQNIPKSRSHEVYLDKKLRHVAKRLKYLIPRLNSTRQRGLLLSAALASSSSSQ